jgi:hypothetical protein
MIATIELIQLGDRYGVKLGDNCRWFATLKEAESFYNSFFEGN